MYLDKNTDEYYQDTFIMGDVIMVCKRADEQLLINDKMNEKKRKKEKPLGLPWNCHYRRIDRMKGCYIIILVLSFSFFPFFLSMFHAERMLVGECRSSSGSSLS